MSRQPAKKYARGFTFIELLVAITIFAIIAASIYATFNAGIRIWQRGNLIIAGNQKARVFFNSITSDLRNAVAYNGAGLEGNRQGLALYAAINVSDENGMHRELAKVAYRFDGNNNAVKNIRSTRKEGFDEDRAEAVVLVDGLKKCRFEYCYESPLEPQGIAWGDTWLYKDRFPTGVRIELRFDDERIGDEGVFEKVIFLPKGELLPKE